MIENQIHKYKITKSAFKSFLLSTQQLLDEVFYFFSLRRSKRFWGVVYDSVTKEPLDPVIVKLIYADGREAETVVSDIAGRYGFLARPGKFKIFARKTNYSFPSKFASTYTDGIYENLYHGEFFTLSEESEVVGPNIPMDPVGFDWNQQAKQQIGKAHAYSRLFLKRLAAVAFWFSLFFFLLSAWGTYPHTPKWLILVLAAYFFLVISAQILPESRLWGKVRLIHGQYGQPSFILELHNSLFPQISFGKAESHDDGKFLLRANKGNYLLTISRYNEEGKKILLGSLDVTVGRAGVLNDNIKLKQVL